MDNVTRLFGDLNDADIATPNCPDCLQRMEPRGFGQEMVWWCPNCYAVQLN